MSGIFLRADRLQVAVGATIGLCVPERGSKHRATLLELGMSDMMLAGVEAPPIGSEVRAVFVLEGRYIEFELPGVVTFQGELDFCVAFSYLTARQTYGLTLAIEIARQAARIPGFSPGRSVSSIPPSGTRAVGIPAPVIRVNRG